MNNNREQRLEQIIDRELKALPLRKAPSRLSQQIMARVQEKSRVPWYRQSWQNWPFGLKAFALTFLVLFSAGAYLGFGQLLGSEAVNSVTTSLNQLLDSTRAFVGAASTLVDALALVLKKMGPIAVACCVALVLFGYATFIGLGSAYLRLATARR